MTVSSQKLIVYSQNVLNTEYSLDFTFLSETLLHQKEIILFLFAQMTRYASPHTLPASKKAYNSKLG